jgi:hypothetical protein
MPVKAKRNYQALAHSDPLAEQAKLVHAKLEKGQYISHEEVAEITKLANSLMQVLHPASQAPDPFLVEGPKSEPAIDKMPTVKAPVVQPEPEPVKQKSGFLGIKS